MKNVLALVILMVVLSSCRLSGIIVDELTGEPIISARIEYNGRFYKSDFDGKFEIRYLREDSMTFVGLGYNSKVIFPPLKKSIDTVRLESNLDIKDSLNIKWGPLHSRSYQN